MGFYTRSVALIADAFHYVCEILTFLVYKQRLIYGPIQLNDLVGFIVALTALKVKNIHVSLGRNRSLIPYLLQISSKNDLPKGLSFGWQRAQLLGAFFNGVFLLALGISILLQSLQRFISLQRALSA